MAIENIQFKFNVLLTEIVSDTLNNYLILKS